MRPIAAIPSNENILDDGHVCRYELSIFPSSALVRIATGQLVRVRSRLSSDVARLEWRVSQDTCEGPNAAKLEKH